MVSTLAPVGPRILDQADDPIEVGLIDRRAVVAVGDDASEHVAQGGPGGVDEAVHLVVGDEHVVGADADLSTVDHATARDPGRRPRDVGTGRDDDGVLAAELQRHRNQVLRGGPLHQRARPTVSR